jgi:hypothetical protein
MRSQARLWVERKKARTAHDCTVRALVCESLAIPLVLSWMIIYLTARPKAVAPVLPGLRPTRACAPTWTCTVAEIARLIRPSPAGMRFYSSLRVPASQGDSLPHRRLTPPGLASCANFFRLQVLNAHVKQARTSPKAVPGSSSPRHPGKGDSQRRISPLAQRDHLPDSHVDQLWSTTESYTTRIAPPRPQLDYGKQATTRFYN